MANGLCDARNPSTKFTKKSQKISKFVKSPAMLLHPSPRLPATLRRRLSITSALPFPPAAAPFHRHLSAAVEAVERACSLCLHVKKSLLSSTGSVLEKTDRTPVTVADFGVQALISLELGRLFPDIPLVAEEDSTSLRTSIGMNGGSSLVDYVVSAVVDKASDGGTLTTDEVLGAIDRGGLDAASFDEKPATYWVLDPIDGTRGFLKGSDAMYVVGLALLVDGEIALGVMGCPNWKDLLSNDASFKETDVSGPGIIMVAHVGCGTWKRKLQDVVDNRLVIQNAWERCFIDSCTLVHTACFCIPDSQTWDSLPIGSLFSDAVDSGGNDGRQNMCLLPTCCGSLCKYMSVASGRASVFILRAKAQTIIKAWDHAVGVLCVLEAGGQVTDWRGSYLDLEADQGARRVIFPSGGVLVTNGHLHSQILDIISSSS